MRPLRIIEHISLDGVIQVSASPRDERALPYGDWTAPYRTPAGLARVLEFYGERCDVLLGRRTYDQWAEFWPHAPASPMADLLRAATKFVATHRPDGLRWGPVERIGPDVVADVRALKATGDRQLIVAGSSSLTSSLIEHGLAEELVLLVNPVLLGTGRRLFASGASPRAFELQRSEPLASGIVVNHYRWAGSLRTPTSP